MRTTLLTGGLLAAAGLLTGCDPAKPTAPTATTRTAEQKARDAGAAVGAAADRAADALGKAADRVGAAVDQAGDAAKENVVKPVEAMYPRVEERIKGLSGDAAKTANEKYARVKTLVAEFRSSSADGLGSAKDKLMVAVEDLKQAVGL